MLIGFCDYCVLVGSYKIRQCLKLQKVVTFKNALFSHLPRFISGIADLVGWVVEEVGKLAQVLGRIIELLLFLSPIVDRLLQLVKPENMSKARPTFIR